MYRMHFKSKVIVTDNLLDDERKFTYTVCCQPLGLKSINYSLHTYKMILILKQLTVTTDIIQFVRSDMNYCISLFVINLILVDRISCDIRAEA